MQQNLKLKADGTVGISRMQPHSPSAAQKRPGPRLSRLQQLLHTQEPNICIVRGEGIGDVLMTLPLVHTLKNMFKQVNITYATNTSYLGGALAKVLMYNPSVNNIIERDIMDPGDYDLTINLHCPCIHYEVRGNPPINRIDLFANHLSVPLLDKKIRYYIQPDEIEKGKRFLEPIKGKSPILLVQPSASNERRSLNHSILKQSLTELYQSHKIQSVIITHSKDFRTDTIWNNIPGSFMLHNADIREIAGVMVHCDMVLCPDSSILHLAGALGAPTVSLFGPTHPDARINYFPNTVAIWEARELKPCPCWYDARCPIGETCWKRITPQLITSTVINRLQVAKKVDILQLLRMNVKMEIKTELV